MDEPTVALDHPRFRRVWASVFTRQAVADCMTHACTMVDTHTAKPDACCQYGCDVNLAERDRILAIKDGLRPFVAAPPEQWFKDEIKEDPEYETGKFVRTRVVKGACAFLSPNGRGCGIHCFALARGLDYHSIKPAVCWLFPVTWDKGVLRPSWDVTDDLVCRETGPVLYDIAREELGRFFGAPLLAELDGLRLSAG